MRVQSIHTTFGIIDTFEWDDEAGERAVVLEATTGDHFITIEFFAGTQQHAENPNQCLCGFLIVREINHVPETAIFVGERDVAIAKFNELLAESMATNKDWATKREALGDFLPDE